MPGKFQFFVLIRLRFYNSTMHDLIAGGQGELLEMASCKSTCSLIVELLKSFSLAFAKNFIAGSCVNQPVLIYSFTYGD